MSMRYRLLGRTGLRISEVLLGAMPLGEEEIGASSHKALRVLALYGEAGGNLIDTANSYSGGRSETSLGPGRTADRSPRQVRLGR
ncbi:aldo/keto reductase [Spongiactinospora sp. 9N601]|uniref:aldo/keto reductase n=1 Tax=Spongiactinospora sp. 9N601 TaxID=3375149 RepID=UPI0037AC564A